MDDWKAAFALLRGVLQLAPRATRKRLTELELSDCGLNLKEVRELCRYLLPLLPGLRCLNLQGNKLGSAAGELLGKCARRKLFL